jgi:hypothetical protein
LKFIDVSEQPAPAIYKSICPEDRDSSSLQLRVFPGTPSTGEKYLTANLATNVHNIVATNLTISSQRPSQYHRNKSFKISLQLFSQ